jgi:hypothetical protein
MKTSLRVFCLVSSTFLATIFLTSCSGVSSNSGITRSHTVIFQNENGVEVGFQYVADGKPLDAPRPYNNVAYDYAAVTKSTKAWNKLVFSSWAGTYDSLTNSSGEKEVVDITSIKGDATVKAVFVDQAFGWKPLLHNGSSLIRPSSDKDPYFYGDKFLASDTTKFMPDFTSVTTPTTDEKWGYSANFKGYSLTKDTSSADAKFFLPSVTTGANYYYGSGVIGESGVTVKKYGEDTAYSGSYAPSSLYEDMATENYYAYDGSWTKVGNIGTEKSGTVNYYAGFSSEKTTFHVEFFSDDTLASSLVSIEALFGEPLVISSVPSDEHSALVTYTGASGATGQNVSLGTRTYSELKRFTGSFSSATGVPSLWSGKTIASDYIIGASINLYPVYIS